MSIRNKVRAGRYALVLVAVNGGIAFGANTPNGIESFGRTYPDGNTAQNEAARKFGVTPTLPTIKPNLSSLTVAKLRELAKSDGVKGWSKLTKDKLIEALSVIKIAA